MFLSLKFVLSSAIELFLISNESNPSVNPSLIRNPLFEVDASRIDDLASKSPMPSAAGANNDKCNYDRFRFFNFDKHV